MKISINRQDLISSHMSTDILTLQEITFSLVVFVSFGRRSFGEEGRGKLNKSKLREGEVSREREREQKDYLLCFFLSEDVCAEEKGSAEI
jgi:hypothetical protein